MVEAIRAAGVQTLSGIATAFNTRGIAAARGTKWYASSVRNLSWLDQGFLLNRVLMILAIALNDLKKTAVRSNQSHEQAETILAKPRRAAGPI